MGYTLPWSHDEDDTERVASDITTESRLIGVSQGNVFEGLLCDGKHVVCAIQGAAHFAGHLFGRPEGRFWMRSRIVCS